MSSLNIIYLFKMAFYRDDSDPRSRNSLGSSCAFSKYLCFIHIIELNQRGQQAYAWGKAGQKGEQRRGTKEDEGGRMRKKKAREGD